MKTKVFACNLLIISLFICQPVFSETQASRDSVEKLVQLSMSESMIESIYGQVGQIFKSTLAQKQSLTGDEMLVVDKYSQKLETMMKEELGIDTLETPMIDIMSKHYNQKEVDGLITFYESDVGQSMLKKQPVIMGEMMPMVMGLLQEKMPKIQALSMEMLEELKALEPN